MDIRGYSPPSTGRPGEINVWTFSVQSLGVQLHGTDFQTVASAAWPAAGLVIYVPFVVPEPVTVRRLWFGSSVAAGNGDIGVYDETGSLLVSTGSFSISSGNSFNTRDVTNTTIGRGRYYFGAVVDTITTLTMRSVAVTASTAQGFGLLEQTGVTLPLSTGANPATFAKYTRAYVPIVGFTGWGEI